MKILTFGLLVSMLCSSFLNAQEMKVYESPQHVYASGGFFHLGSDISRPAFTGWSAAMGYQTYLKDIRTPFFLRVGVIYAQDQNVDKYLISSPTYGFNETLEGLGYDNFVRNYSTTFVGMQARIAYDFVKWQGTDEKQRLGIYVLAGPDIVYYTAKYDALDANGDLYDFSNIDFNKDDTKEEVESMLDGEYETDAPEGQTLDIGFGAGLGIQYHFNKVFGIGLEHQVGLTFTDKLDGFVSSDGNDSINHTRFFVFTSLW